MTNRIYRRSFLERLGLASCAPFLGSLLEGFESEARGAPTSKKRLLFVVSSNGHQWYRFTPPEYQAGAPAEKLANGKLVDTSAFQLPAALASLSAYRNSMILCDGLSNRNASGHTGTFSMFSCVPNLRDGVPVLGEGGSPGGITIDQHIAGAIGLASREKSLLLCCGDGMHNEKTGPTFFAAGAKAALPSDNVPTKTYQRLFGPAGIQDFKSKFLRRTALLDASRQDFKKAMQHLGPEERLKLEIHLQAIANLEKRNAAVLAAGAPTINGKFSIDASVDKSPYHEDVMEAQTAIAAQALASGITRVAAVIMDDISVRYTRELGHVKTASCKDKNNPCPPPESSFQTPDLHFIGHGLDGNPYLRGGMTTEQVRNHIYNYHGRLISNVIKTLQATPEEDGTAFDHTVIVWVSDAAEAHHARFFRVPFVLIAGSKTGFRTGGRYLRYPAMTKEGEATRSGGRSLADFYMTLAHVMGAPVDDFGKGGKEEIKGPLSEFT